MRRFTAISALACMLRSSMGCAKRSFAARSAALHANASLRREAPQLGAAHTMLHCAAKQHFAVLRSSTLLCCEAALCCAAKQHVAVLRSSTLLCCEAARGAKRRWLARSDGIEARSAEHVTVHAALPKLLPPGRSVWRGPRDLVPRRVGVVKRSGARPLRGLAILIPR